MAQYLLLLYHNGAEGAKLDPKILQSAMTKHQAWRQALRDKGIYLASNRLENEPGKVLRNGGARSW